MNDPIVVTGLGAVSPLGASVRTNWQRLLAGHSGIGLNTRFDTAGWKCQIAGLVPSIADDPEGFDASLVMSAPELRKTDLFIHYAMAAAQEALQQAHWQPQDTPARARTATIVGTGVGGIPAITAANKTLAESGPRRLSPFLVPSFLPNLAAGQIAIHHGFYGPSGAPTTACAASAQAIGDAMRLIRSGEADIAVCGGTDACVDPVSIGGFTAAKALAFNHNENPTQASRPFDAQHEGFVLSEGAAMLVIERLSHAQQRGATPLAVLSGYGTTTDAHHVTAGWSDGREAARAIQLALAMAGLESHAIDYINAHATSTAVGDAAEIAAIAQVFGANGGGIALGSTKSATGHMLGAAGAIEAVFSVMALQSQTLPPSLNIEAPMPEAAGFNLLSSGAQPAKVEHVLSNAFGFGGVNAALVFSRAPQD